MIYGIWDPEPPEEPPYQPRSLTGTAKKATGCTSKASTGGTKMNLYKLSGQMQAALDAEEPVKGFAASVVDKKTMQEWGAQA